ncbi:MAG: phosphoribosylamine--glycine ligase [Pseudonocardiales bacterium]
MRVLVIGAGAREHALALALSRDPSVTALACAPGNAGTAVITQQHAVDVTDPAEVAQLAKSWSADLVVIGPEGPLVAGAADAVRAAGIACFGPSAGAAQIEGSKAFAKDVMAVAGVPTARNELVDNPARLDAALHHFGPPWVVKDDRPAGGKGVVVTEDLEVARVYALTLLDGGHPVLLESYLDGPEVSLFCLVDSSAVVPLLPAQDFKRVGEGDVGPNTGGMGAYAPLPWAPESLATDVVAQIVQPVVDELGRRGKGSFEGFSGLLYAGLALTADGPQVIEFNCRFGDPETQAVLALLRTPLAGLLHATATGALSQQPPLRWDPGAAIAIVVAAEGYPGIPRTGDVITGAHGAGILHAGTRRRDDGAVVSAGGRVLTVVGTGVDLAAAREQAYQRVAQVHLPGSHYRSDIGLRATRRES